MQKTVILLLLFFPLQLVFSQQVDILIKGGHVIDPKNGINDYLDVAVSHGRIVRVAKHINSKQAIRVVDATGMLVVPGLIDIHTHDFYGPDAGRCYCNGTGSLNPDGFTFCTGVTTVVDAGSSGWRDFPVFKKNIIDHSQTRVLAFLNIVGAGMRGGPYEQDIKDMDAEKTARVAEQYRDDIVGIKFAHYKGPEWKPLDEAIQAGRLAKIPVMVDFGDNPFPLSIRELFLKHMRSGDIFTHCYAELKGRDPLVDTATRKLKSFVWEARKRGISFDVGYGEISFSFSQAIPAINDGFYPSSISSDMHACNKVKPSGMLDIMSEFLALGMGIQDVIKTVTWNPAREIRHEELGNLSTGAIADIAILRVHYANTGFCDHTGFKLDGSEKFICRMTIRNGKIVYDKLKPHILTARLDDSRKTPSPL